VAYVKLGDADNTTFVERLKDYANIDVVSGKTLDVVMKKLKGYDTVIVGYHKSNLNPWKSFNFKNQELVWLQEIARKNCVILDVFSKGNFKGKNGTRFSSVGCKKRRSCIS